MDSAARLRGGHRVDLPSPSTSSACSTISSSCASSWERFLAALADAGDPRGRDRPDHDHLQAGAPEPGGYLCATASRTWAVEQFVQVVARTRRPSSRNADRAAHRAAAEAAEGHGTQPCRSSSAGSARAGTLPFRTRPTRERWGSINASDRAPGRRRSSAGQPLGRGRAPPPRRRLKPPGRRAADKESNMSAADVLRAKLLGKTAGANAPSPDPETRRCEATPGKTPPSRGHGRKPRVLGRARRRRRRGEAGEETRDASAPQGRDSDARGGGVQQEAREGDQG